jgi:hypothetical protein
MENGLRQDNEMRVRIPLLDTKDRIAGAGSTRSNRGNGNKGFRAAIFVEKIMFEVYQDRKCSTEIVQDGFCTLRIVKFFNRKDYNESLQKFHNHELLYDWDDLGYTMTWVMPYDEVEE